MEKDKHIQMQEYLDKIMSGEESTAFEKELISDTELQLEFELLKDIEQELGNSELDDFKKKLSGVMEQPIQATTVEKKSGRVISLSRRVLSLAASFLLIGLTTWWFFSQPTSPQQMYANNFSVPPDVLTVEITDGLSETGFGSSLDALKILQEAMNNYNSGNYEVAIQQFRDFRSAAPEDVLVNHARFYEAVSLLKTEKSTEAQSQLEILNVPTFPLQQDAQWYLALTYLKQGNVEAAKPILQILSSVQKYQKEAASILNKL